MQGDHLYNWHNVLSLYSWCNLVHFRHSVNRLPLRLCSVAYHVRTSGTWSSAAGSGQIWRLEHVGSRKWCTVEAVAGWSWGWRYSSSAHRLECPVWEWPRLHPQHPGSGGSRGFPFVHSGPHLGIWLHLYRCSMYDEQKLLLEHLPVWSSSAITWHSPVYLSPRGYHLVGASITTCLISTG